MNFIKAFIIFCCLHAPIVLADDLDDLGLAIELYENNDFETAGPEFLRLAKKGIIEAQHYVAGMYFDGLGFKANAEESVYWFRKSADQLHLPSQYALGIIYHKGAGIPRNLSESVKWFTKAAKQGHASAQYNLATAYLTGTGVDKDLSQALSWYQQSADQGSARAQHAVAVLYQKGEGAPQDFAKARYWYWIAANNNYAPSQYNLGLFYAEKTGDLEQNKIKAYMWLAIAARNGFTEATTFGQELIRSMTRQEVEEAKTLARNWKPEGNLNQ